MKSLAEQIGNALALDSIGLVRATVLDIRAEVSSVPVKTRAGATVRDQILDRLDARVRNLEEAMND